ncbi:MAG: hypothetical protein ACT4P6_16250 [Gemmatimonadaceae bacterium]
MTATQIAALTLLHFLWQGALIHLALVTILSLARPRTSHVRYFISTLALGLMAVAPIVTAIRLSQTDARTASLAMTTSDAKSIEQRLHPT